MIAFAYFTEFFIIGTLDNNTNYFTKWVKKQCTEEEAISIIDKLKTKYPNKNFGFFSLEDE